MKLFINKSHKKRTLISIPVVIVTYMLFMPFGSFDPNSIGFWLSIISGLLGTVVLNMIMVKYHVPGSDKKSSDQDQAKE